MKTTIDIADAVLDEAKRIAARDGVTVRALVEEGLRAVVARRREPPVHFKLRDAAFRGNGVQPGVELSDWGTIRSTIYGDRGR